MAALNLPLDNDANQNSSTLQYSLIKAFADGTLTPTEHRTTALSVLRVASRRSHGIANWLLPSSTAPVSNKLRSVKLLSCMAYLCSKRLAAAIPIADLLHLFDVKDKNVRDAALLMWTTWMASADLSTLCLLLESKRIFLAIWPHLASNDIATDAKAQTVHRFLFVLYEHVLCNRLVSKTLKIHLFGVRSAQQALIALCALSDSGEDDGDSRRKICEMATTLIRQLCNHDATGVAFSVANLDFDGLRNPVLLGFLDCIEQKCKASTAVSIPTCLVDLASFILGFCLDLYQFWRPSALLAANVLLSNSKINASQSLLSLLSGVDNCDRTKFVLSLLMLPRLTQHISIAQLSSNLTGWILLRGVLERSNCIRLEFGSAWLEFKPALCQLLPDSASFESACKKFGASVQSDSQLLSIFHQCLCSIIENCHNCDIFLLNISKLAPMLLREIKVSKLRQQILKVWAESINSMQLSQVIKQILIYLADSEASDSLLTVMQMHPFLFPYKLEMMMWAKSVEVVPESSKFLIDFMPKILNNPIAYYNDDNNDSILTAGLHQNDRNWDAPVRLLEYFENWTRENDSTELIEIDCKDDNADPAKFEQQAIAKPTTSTFSRVNKITNSIRSAFSNGKSMQQAHITTVLSEYSATLSLYDQALFALMTVYDKRFDLGKLGPVVWGDSAVQHYVTQRIRAEWDVVVEQITGDNEMWMRSLNSFPNSLHLQVNLSDFQGDNMQISQMQDCCNKKQMKRTEVAAENAINIDRSDIFDPRWVLSQLANILDDPAAECSYIVRSNLPLMAIMATASSCDHLRSLAFLCLTRLRVSLRSSSPLKFPERLALLYLMNLIKNSCKFSNQRVPSIVASFLIKFYQLLMDPSKRIARVVIKEVIRFGMLDFKKLPISAIKVLRDSLDSRLWLLEVINTGLKDTRDFWVLKNSGCITILFTMCLTADSTIDYRSRVLCLKIILKMLDMSSVFRVLLESECLLAWISQAVHVLSSPEMLNCVSDVINIVNLKLIRNGDRFAKVCLRSTVDQFKRKCNLLNLQSICDRLDKKVVL